MRAGGLLGLGLLGAAEGQASIPPHQPLEDRRKIEVAQFQRVGSTAREIDAFVRHVIKRSLEKESEQVKQVFKNPKVYDRAFRYYRLGVTNKDHWDAMEDFYARTERVLMNRLEKVGEDITKMTSAYIEFYDLRVRAELLKIWKDYHPALQRTLEDPRVLNKRLISTPC